MSHRYAEADDAILAALTALGVPFFRGLRWTFCPPACGGGRVLGFRPQLFIGDC